MHPATATTPFTLLWGLGKNEEDAPFLSFASSPRTPAQQPSRTSPTTRSTTAQRTELNGGSTRAYEDAQPESPTASGTPSQSAHDCLSASDFLVTNLRPDLLD